MRAFGSICSPVYCWWDSCNIVAIQNLLVEAVLWLSLGYWQYLLRIFLMAKVWWGEPVRILGLANLFSLSLRFYICTNSPHPPTPPPPTLFLPCIFSASLAKSCVKRETNTIDLHFSSPSSLRHLKNHCNDRGCFYFIFVLVQCSPI